MLCERDRLWNARRKSTSTIRGGGSRSSCFSRALARLECLSSTRVSDAVRNETARGRYLRTRGFAKDDDRVSPDHLLQLDFQCALLPLSLGRRIDP